jgi:hypothetical protein
MIKMGNMSKWHQFGRRPQLQRSRQFIMLSLWFIWNIAFATAMPMPYLLR